MRKNAAQKKAELRAFEAAGRAAEKEINLADRGLRTGPIEEVYAGIGRKAVAAYRRSLLNQEKEEQ